MTNALTKLAYLLVKPHMRGLKKMMDTSETGGAPLLGISKPVIKAHGNPKALAIKNAIRVAAEFSPARRDRGIAAAVKPSEKEKAAPEPLRRSK